MKKCLTCQKEIFGPNWLVKIRQFCSNKCRGLYFRGKSLSPETQIKKGQRLSKRTEFKKGGNLGKDHPRWKGGRWLMKNGYIAIRNINHPRAMANGYVYEHVLVAEKKHGRPILSTENVHHINGIKDDNRPENLVVCQTFSDHMRAYHNDRKKLT